MVPPAGFEPAVFCSGGRFDVVTDVHWCLTAVGPRGVGFPCDLRTFVHVGLCEYVAVRGGLRGEFRMTCVIVVSLSLRSGGS
jgi:hypothetical protein